MRRIRDHESVEYELRGAHVRTARKARHCDLPNCYLTAQGRMVLERDFLAIQPGHTYAYINTGIAVCDAHFQPEDVVNAE